MTADNRSLAEELCDKDQSLETFEITQKTVSEDGSGHAMIEFKVSDDPKGGASSGDVENPQTATGLTDEANTTKAEWEFGTKESTEEPSEKGEDGQNGSKGPWEVAGKSLSWNQLREVRKAHSAVEYKARSGDELAERIREVTGSDGTKSDDGENKENENTSDTPEAGVDVSEIEGVKKKVSESGTPWYHFDGEKMTRCGLQKAVKTENYPSVQTTENLIEAYRQQSGANTTEGTETTENVERENTQYTGKGQPSPEWLKNHGVDASDAETVPRFRKKNDPCAVGGCEYGANKNGNVCKDCSEKGLTGDDTIEVTYNQDRGSKIQQIMKLRECSQVKAEEVYEDLKEQGEI